MTRKLMARAVLPVALLALAAPTLTACSSDSGSGGGSSKADFCKLDKNLELDDALSDVDPTDPKAAVDAISTINDKIKDVQAPDEIKEAWGSMQKFFADFSQAVDGVDTSDPTAFASALQDTDLQSEAATMQDAGQKISDYVSKNCS
ncbi:hypothetical protein ACFT5B_02920 [Luteimicrobium sp. NPDC057192]|uniref:hypothetical protein n=1 Tax=Luteimicrobium sp. NPDC057192 TaxID=3346042 RepID=UPI003639652A